MIRHQVRHHEAVTKELVPCEATPTEVADDLWHHRLKEEKRQERLHELYTAAGYLNTGNHKEIS